MSAATDSTTRCGIIAIVGRPNVGKSTLLNALVDDKLAIVSPRPQATRHPVVGIRTDGSVQLLFVDLPGLLDPSYLLHQAMRHAAVAWVRRADAVLLLHPAASRSRGSLAHLLPESGDLATPVAMLLTKADRRGSEAPAPSPGPSFVTSAVSGRGLPEVIQWCRDLAPPGPFRHDPGDVSIQPLRFFVAEFVREAAFETLQEELPYALAAEVDEFREGSAPLYIRVTVFVERQSQKRMVIGKHGSTIKTLGTLARKKIETLVHEPVFLDLWIKVLPKWRSKPDVLARFGLPISEGSRL